MRKILSRFIIAALVVGTVSPAFADRWGKKQERREERREERRDERRDRHEERKERREDRQDRRQDRRDERRDNRWSDGRVRRRAPPSARVERWRAKPGHIWVTGHWDWRGNDYVWVGGRYERERRGYRWRDARYEERDGDYVMVDGGWMSVGPSSAPPPVRVERYDNRRGYVYVSGNWNWSGNQWVWVAGHYERERRGYRYREPRWEQQNDAWISVQGAWEVN